MFTTEPANCPTFFEIKTGLCFTVQVFTNSYFHDYCKIIVLYIHSKRGIYSGNKFLTELEEVGVCGWAHVQTDVVLVGQCRPLQSVQSNSIFRLSYSVANQIIVLIYILPYDKAIFLHSFPIILVTMT